MSFPFWQYLNQPLWDDDRPPIFNPFQYWHRYQLQRLQSCLTWQNYQVRHLNRCLHNASLEHCWHVQYQDFVQHYQEVCARNTLEEDPVWLLERCWQIEPQDRYRHPFYPENPASETERW